ncbi:MAG: galactose-1-phosphate uridylyltransferase [Deltaproteobacteria bacterium]|nr:galactose-1-phosphate uridylyltransferase [Deltaproteobacteria bacterium]
MSSSASTAVAPSTVGRWEQRWHPLRQEWVLVAAHRQTRPWSGGTSDSLQASAPAHDPSCHLCPGNRRVSGIVNAHYTTPFVFNNDHPCVGADAPLQLPPPPGLHRNAPALGVAKVVCYSPVHNLSLSQLPRTAVVDLLHTLAEEYTSLASRPEVNHVLVFENKGVEVGVSNPHPHCQIYATNFVFKTLEVECAAAAAHHSATGRVLFQDIIAAELEQGAPRVVVQNEGSLAFVPYFARYPYEVYVSPKRTVASLADLSAPEREDFAATLQELLIRYDNLWQRPFPYVMVLHQAPTNGTSHPGFHFHIQLHPPLRAPTLLKYLAGPEIGGGCFLNDTTPEDKAAELKAVSPIHFATDPNEK